MNRIGFIYQIRNIENDKRYIGSTIEPNKRFAWHQRYLRIEKHHSIRLQRAWQKYGEKNFVFEIIRTCDAEMILQEEQKEINLWNFDADLYNTNPLAEKPPIFYGEEHKMSKLTWEQVNEIRKRYDNNEKDQYELATIYQVKQGQIWNVVHNKTWYDPNYQPKMSYASQNMSRGSGEDHHNAKFTNEQIADMRKRYTDGKITLEQLGEEVDTDKGVIYNIIQNKTYHDPSYNPPSSKDVKKHGKMNWNLVRQIRQEWLSTKITQQQIADKYELSRGSMLELLNNKTWIDVEYVNTRRRKENSSNENQ